MLESSILHKGICFWSFEANWRLKSIKFKPKAQKLKVSKCYNALKVYAFNFTLHEMDLNAMIESSSPKFHICIAIWSHLQRPAYTNLVYTTSLHNYKSSWSTQKYCFCRQLQENIWHSRHTGVKPFVVKNCFLTFMKRN